MSYGLNANVLTIFEENNYYPFGLKHKGYNSNNLQANYKYKYNGKELQDELGLNMYDYGARNYDPAIGRWMNIDPLAETSRRYSPYTYALNNPVFFIDPDGMKADTFFQSRYLNNNGTGGIDQYIDKGPSIKNEATADGDSENSESYEPPVTFFLRENSNFIGVFDQKNKKGNYKVGDGVFDVFGHGGVDGAGDGFFQDQSSGTFFDIGNAKQFDDKMSELSPAYAKKIKEKGGGEFTLNLYLCQSGTGSKSMAKKISKAHPRAIVVGFDGFVRYGSTNGVSTINGVSSLAKGNDHNGYRVVFQNGKEIGRMLYSTYIKSTNNKPVK